MVKHINTLRRNYRKLQHFLTCRKHLKEHTRNHILIFHSGLVSLRLFAAQKHSSERKTRHRSNTENKILMVNSS